MTQHKGTKKSDRHHRTTRSRHEAAPHHAESAPDAQADEAARASASDSSLMLPNSAEDDHPAQADQKPMPLAIRPPHLPAEFSDPQHIAAPAASSMKRKLPTAVQAILISACLTVAVILSLGTLKGNRSAAQVAQAEPAAPIAAVAAGPVAGTGLTARRAPSLKNGTTAMPAAGGDAKSGRIASKAPASTPRTEKQRSQARSAHPIAGNAKKKPAASIAKAPKTPVEEHSVPLLAQNSAPASGKSSIAQSGYAQCQELGSFFRREQCKWQACNGKWGQDGCPSYSSGNREFN